MNPLFRLGSNVMNFQVCIGMLIHQTFVNTFIDRRSLQSRHVHTVAYTV